VTGNGKPLRDAQLDPRSTIHDPRVSIIVAMAKNRVIGARGGIPWHLPEELKRFKSLTMGHHIVMGRKTWESIGRLLPGRETVVVTRQKDYRVPGATVVHSLPDAIAASGDDKEIFVIGGAELVELALPLAGRLYLTTVDAEVPGDTYMPEFDISRWREVASESVPADARNQHAFQLKTYERVAN
jgi:dihydrofolate reductase